MASNSTVHKSPYAVCKQVSDLCPVAATTLGYYPNEGLNIFFAVGFGLAAVITLVFGVWKRTWSFMAFIVAGCFLELAGYAARVALSSNPWNQSAFETQICAIILAPTLICISIYLTIKHLTLALNPSLSRVRPRLYPFIFVPADVSCLLVQAIGGSLAASAGRTNAKLLQDGNRAIIAGICLQVVVLLAFGVLCLDYFLRVKKWIHSAEVTPEAKALWEDKKFGLFGCAILGAYGCILIRCVYRVAEMAGGWGNYIMQDEPSFAVLDSAMVLIASMLLACFAPGIFFPQMSRRAKLSYGGKREKKSDTAVNTGDEREEDLEQGGLKVEEETREPSAAPSS